MTMSHCSTPPAHAAHLREAARLRADHDGVRDAAYRALQRPTLDATDLPYEDVCDILAAFAVCDHPIPASPDPARPVTHPSILI